MIIIDAYRGGSDVGYTGNGIVEKDFNLLVSKYMYDRFKELGIDTYITRDSDIDLNINDRSEKILNAFGNNSNVILLSNRVRNNDEDGVNIIYSLKNSNNLSNKLENSFNNNGINVNKVYQRRDENDTSLDYDELMKKTGNIQAIIIDYGNVNSENDAKNMKDEYKKYAESIIETITTYLGVPYYNNFNDIYVVQKGDSLWSISKKYGLTVDELKRINNLTSNLLSIGQILRIPN